jgi:hypothetical protein
MKGSSLNLVFSAALKVLVMKAQSCSAAPYVAFTLTRYFCTNKVSSSQEWFLGHLVRVKVTLRLRSGHSVHSSAEAPLGLIIKLYSAYSVADYRFWSTHLDETAGLPVVIIHHLCRLYIFTYKQTHTHTRTYIHVSS